MLKRYIVYYPQASGSIEEEWEQCRVQIVNDLSLGIRPIKLNIFVNRPDYPSYVQIKKFISDSVTGTFGDICPAFNVSVHPPEKPGNVAVEALFIEENQAGITTRFYGSLPYVVIETDSVKEVWAAGLGDDQHMDDTRRAAAAAFEMVLEILRREGLTLDHIVRQWNFIGEILKMKEGFQNYQVFNEVRSEYYNKFRTVSGYPAATGVGMKHGGVFLDFCALKADETIKLKAVNNPGQVNAYDYGQQVLKGMANSTSALKHPPQFERGLLLANRTSNSLFVSGTASIIGQETIGKGDVEEQALVTIENIRNVADLKRIRHLTGKDDIGPGKFSLLRVYIKKQEDFKTVKNICNDHFPGSPVIFIEADICRDDLLTEIEAEVSI